MYSKLEDLFKDTPHIRLANPSDNKKILEFYHQTEMKGENTSIKYGRGDDFFLFLKERTKDNLIFTLWDDDQNLEGVAVVSYRPGFINGEKVIIGYLGDLRVNLNRKLIREWRHMFSLFIKYSASLSETFYCRYYQTVIIDNNLKAKRNLVETKIQNLKYQPMMNYKMINIIGRIKLPYLSKYKIVPAKMEELKLIISFLNKYDSKRNFGRDWEIELPYRLNNWKNFSIDQVLTIQDQNNNIVGVTSFWNPIQTKQVITTKIPVFFKFLVPLLNLFPLIDLKPLPIAGKPIDILYLNQFVFSDSLTLDDENNIVHQTIDYLFSQKFSMLAFCSFECKKYLNFDWKYIKHQIPMTMYSVHYHNPETKEIRDPLFINSKNDPGFEMALV